jgi:hypothetical protein
MAGWARSGRIFQLAIQLDFIIRRSPAMKIKGCPYSPKTGI